MRPYNGPANKIFVVVLVMTATCLLRQSQAEDFIRPLTVSDEPLGELSLFAGIDGAKQPQDFGVNANLGGRASINWSHALHEESGLGFQIGSALVASGNAVRVYELLGENSGRVQSFSTVGVFQRLQSGWKWGVAHDFLYQESYDNFFLSQTRINTAFGWDRQTEIGMNVYLPGARDSGNFNATRVNLETIAQGHIYCRQVWESQAQTTVWFGVAEGHSEDNAVTGPSRPQDESFVMGADILAPLNDRVAIYGETNLMFPADTGTVDAFLGFQYYPRGGAFTARKRRFAPIMPVAGSTSFSVDLSQ